jgi:hypothetical protein
VSTRLDLAKLKGDLAGGVTSAELSRRLRKANAMISQLEG